MIIAVDFDGTCVTHDYPAVGKEIGADVALKKIAQDGHQLILYTMRSGKELQDAIDWFNRNDIPLYGIQTNPTQKSWTDSPKAYANLYIDDAAFGAPLINDSSISNRPFIDWSVVSNYFGHQ